MRTHLVSHELRNEVRCLQQPSEIDVGLDAHLAQHINEIFGGDIARGPRSEGAATEATDRGIKGAYASIKGGHDVSEGETARVMEVRADIEVGVGIADTREGVEDLSRVSNSDRITERGRSIR